VWTRHDRAGDGTGTDRRVAPGALGIVFTTVLIDLIGFGIALPLLPLWAERLGASALEVGVLLSVYALCQVLAAPLWGRASDRHGRRPVILIALAGAGAAALLTGLASSLWLLFVARALHGAAGASYVAAQAYAADVSRPGERARALGLVGAAFGIGFAVGPALGAGLATFGPRVPFLVVAGLSVLNLAWAWARLPESRDPATASPVARRRLWPTGSRRIALLGLALVATAAFVGVEAMFALFAADRLGYAELGVGLLFAFVGVVAAVVQGGLIGPAVRRAGEARVLTGGLALTAAGAAGLAVAGSLWALLPALAALAAGWGFAYSATLALASRSAGTDEQGQVLGEMASVTGIARVAGPLAAGAAFQLVGPSAPLVLTAVVLAGAAVAAPRVLGRTTRRAEHRAGGSVESHARDIRPHEMP
jgi:DHA1 family tetracycline resistance protein-like MFS transporter